MYIKEYDVFVSDGYVIIYVIKYNGGGFIR